NRATVPNIKRCVTRHRAERTNAHKGWCSGSTAIRSHHHASCATLQHSIQRSHWHTLYQARSDLRTRAGVFPSILWIAVAGNNYFLQLPCIHRELNIYDVARTNLESLCNESHRREYQDSSLLRYQKRISSVDVGDRSY